jgi:hypothetical protein
VSRVIGDDGSQACLYYSLIGATLATDLCGREYRPVVGSIRLNIDPESDRYFVMNANLEMGEFHAWFACPDKNDRAIEIVDLSSRHYKRLVTSAVIVEGERVEWRIPDPPPFIWSRPEDFPVFVRLIPDANATNTAGRRVDRDSLREMARIAGEVFRAGK